MLLNLLKNISIYKIMTIIIILGIGLAAYYAEQINNERYKELIHTSVQENLYFIQSNLNVHLQSDIHLVKGLVSFISTYPELNQKDFERAAKPLFDGNTRLRNIGAAPDLIVSLMYPLEGNERAIGLDYRKTTAQLEAAVQAKRTGEMILAGPVNLVQGGEGIIARIPVFTHDNNNKKVFWGLISAVIDIDKMYEQSGLLNYESSIDIAIRGKDAKGAKGEVFFGHNSVFERNPVLINVPLPYGSWQLAAIPSNGWQDQADNVWGLRLVLVSIALLILVPFFALGFSMSALHKARIVAENANKYKTEFLSSMSHEIRTPMNGVIGVTSLLKDTSLNKEQENFVEVIQQSGEAMLHIINDILDLSKLEYGQVELEEVEFNLAEMAADTVKIIAPNAELKKLTLIQNYSPMTHDIYRGDIGRIRQILLNLLSNALKFTEHGQLTINIDAEQCATNNGMVRFEVKDTGIGIPQDKIELLFGIFVQADTSVTRKYGGSGLGLAICKKITAIMGGNIGVESIVAEGSMFWIELPLIYIGNEGSAKPKGYDVVSDNDSHVKIQSLRILLVEDNQINQLVGRKLLEKEGHRVDSAFNGIEALDSVKNRTYDLVFMDIQMPEMDGITATKRIRELRGTLANVPIIAMTANATKEDRDKCLQAGMTDFISKPVDNFKLRESLQRVVDSIG